MRVAVPSRTGRARRFGVAWSLRTPGSVVLAPFATPFRGEERGEKLPALGRSKATRDGQFVVEARVNTEVVERAAGSRPGVDGSEDQAANPGCDQRTGTHRARLERDDHRHLREPPPPERSRRVAQRQHLSVRGGIPRALALVVACGHHLAVVKRDRADWHVPLGCASARLDEGECHGIVVGQRAGCVERGDAPVCELASSERKFTPAVARLAAS
jgi:hypothetical protein